MEIQATTIVTVIVGLIGLFCLPLGGIWAINTLFHSGIEYTFINWIAFAFLQLYLQLVLKAGQTARKTSEK